MRSPSPPWKHTHARLVFALWFGLLASAPHAFGQTVPNVIVRSYNTMGVSSATLHRAETTVHDLLGDAGIASAWRNCRTPEGSTARSTDACDDALQFREVIVRIVGTPRAIQDPDVLGYSHVDPYRRLGTMATVFADRVRALAPGLRLDEGTLLGRAIAHELGHLLLGSLEHSDVGLMRGVWRTPRRLSSDWRFSSAEAIRMRDGLSAREGVSAVAVARSSSSSR